jgi:hypothetical protein
VQEKSTASIQQMTACLERAGGSAEPIEFEPGKQMGAATASNGDEIFIIPLPESGLAGRASRAIKEGVSKFGQVGLLTTRTIDRGSIAIIVIGVDGVDGGLPSLADEELARECAIRPRPGPSAGQPT